SMYPIDSISSNIHTLKDEYIGESRNPKITMSFEHFLAISLDCFLRDLSIGGYLKQRKDYILSHPKARLDVNEIDLFYQITNKNNKSLLSEFSEKGMFKMFNRGCGRFVGLFKQPTPDFFCSLTDSFLQVIA
ncbi:MAG TPA: hypothetical protein VJ861_05050, partial [Treponemataceae bacterium]|nr:hypothetical protein [Treponemataceae bacterium]